MIRQTSDRWTPDQVRGDGGEWWRVGLLVCALASSAGANRWWLFVICFVVLVEIGGLT